MNDDIKKTKDTPKELMVDFSSGAIIGFVSQYIGFVIVNIIQNDQNIFYVGEKTKEYLAGISAGVVGSIFADNLNTVQTVLLTTGVYAGVNRSVGEILDPNTVINEDQFLKDYIIDVILVTIIVTIYNIYRDTFRPPWKRRKISHEDFGGRLYENFNTGFIVTVYFAIRQFLRESQTGNTSEPNNSTNQANQNNQSSQNQANTTCVCICSPIDNCKDDEVKEQNTK